LSVIAALLLLANASNGLSSPDASVLPGNAQPSCGEETTWKHAQPEEFLHESGLYYGYGGSTKTHVFERPDSLSFRPLFTIPEKPYSIPAQKGEIIMSIPNCAFYDWAAQAFLWVTSPSSSKAGGGRVFDSPEFYDVSPPDGHGRRTLIPHVAGHIRRLEVRTSKTDANGLPVVFSTSGQTLEVQPSKLGPHGNTIVRDSAGAQIEISRASVGPGETPVFYDPAGRAIKNANPVLIRPAGSRTNLGALAVTKISVNGLGPIYVDGSGHSVPVEQGQADGAVLEARNGSLVYFAIMVNDVYAYFATGEKNGAFNAKSFPTTKNDLDEIKKFAEHHGKTFHDASALAIELKTAWVEAAGLKDKDSYITALGTIPSYDKSDPDKWKPNGHKTVQLALVGMHVVGSAYGQGSLVWSTFEHWNNAPAGRYEYDKYGGGTGTVDPKIDRDWLFFTNPHSSTAPYDQAHMRQSGSDIVSNPPFHIGPSNTIRWKAFGAASDVAPNPFAGTAASNAEIISINDQVQSALHEDARKSYILIGALWTIGGKAPEPGNEGGATELANSTLETYDQGNNTTSTGSLNCFSCHNNGDLKAMSHIYPDLQPLFRP